MYVSPRRKAIPSASRFLCSTRAASNGFIVPFGAPPLATTLAFFISDGSSDPFGNKGGVGSDAIFSAPFGNDGGVGRLITFPSLSRHSTSCLRTGTPLPSHELRIFTGGKLCSQSAIFFLDGLMVPFGNTGGMGRQIKVPSLLRGSSTKSSFSFRCSRIPSPPHASAFREDNVFFLHFRRNKTPSPSHGFTLST